MEINTQTHEIPQASPPVRVGAYRSHVRNRILTTFSIQWVKLGLLDPLHVISPVSKYITEINILGSWHLVLWVKSFQRREIKVEVSEPDLLWPRKEITSNIASLEDGKCE